MSDLSTTEPPVYLDDRDNLAIWHNGVVPVLFEYAVEQAGWAHCPQGFAWPKPAHECGCAQQGDGCWYCDNKEAA